MDDKQKLNHNGCTTSDSGGDYGEVCFVNSSLDTLYTLLHKSNTVYLFVSELY